MLLIKHSSDEYDDSEAMDLTVSEWESFYETLFGGFEDLKDETESSEEDIPLELMTKEGYSKEDGFVVDDDEEDLEYLSKDEDDILDSNDDSEEFVDENESIVDSEEGDKHDDSLVDSDDDSIVDDSDDSGDESELTEESYLSDNSYD